MEYDKEKIRFVKELEKKGYSLHVFVSNEYTREFQHPGKNDIFCKLLDESGCYAFVAVVDFSLDERKTRNNKGLLALTFNAGGLLGNPGSPLHTCIGKKKLRNYDIGKFENAEQSLARFAKKVFIPKMGLKINPKELSDLLEKK